MPAPITPVSAWTTPEETPAGADVRNAASVENAVQRLANRVEFLKGPRTFSITPAQLGFGGGSFSGAALVGDTPISGAGGETFHCDIGKELRDGEELTLVEVIIDPGSTGVLSVKVYKRVGAGLSIADTQLGSTGSTDGTSNLQPVDVVVAETINRVTTRYFVQVISAQAADRIWTINLTVTP